MRKELEAQVRAEQVEINERNQAEIADRTKEEMAKELKRVEEAVREEAKAQFQSQLQSMKYVWWKELFGT